jgi:hypothetical protein
MIYFDDKFKNYFLKTRKFEKNKISNRYLCIFKMKNIYI